MKRTHKLIAGGTGALVLAVAGAVAAAPYGPAGGCDAAGGPYMGMAWGGMGPGAGGMGPGWGGMHGGGFGAGSAEALAALKTRLAITAEQESAWQAFAKQAAEQAGQMQAMRAQHHAATGADTSAPAMMSLHIGSMTQRLAAMQSMNTALTELYAVLTPQQRATFDGQFGPGRLGGHRHGRLG